MKSHILLVEDDESIAETIVYALQREPFEVHHCTTGIAGESCWQAERIDLAILDVGLPDQTGFELCRKLKAAHPERPVMFLTAQSDEIDRIVGLELGADDYLCKPFSPRELVLRVKAILRRQPSQPIEPHASDEYKAEKHSAELRHDAERMQILLQEIPLPLTKSEYLLLRTMIQQPSRVFTRDNLLDALGDSAGHSSDRAIDTHIKELRNKLRAVESSRDFIITHRGLGYSLSITSPVSVDSGAP